MNPFDNLKASLDECLDIAPGKVVQVFAERCQFFGIRLIVAAIGRPIGAHPQVEITVTMDDVTSRVISQVVDPVLRRVGVPDNAVLLLAAGAGEAAMRAVRQYRETQAKREAMRERMQKAAGIPPVVEAETTEPPATGGAGNWTNKG